MKIRKRHRSWEIATDLRLKAAIQRQIVIVTPPGENNANVQRNTDNLMAMRPVATRVIVNAG